MRRFVDCRVSLCGVVTLHFIATHVFYVVIVIVIVVGRATERCEKRNIHLIWIPKKLIELSISFVIRYEAREFHFQWVPRFNFSHCIAQLQGFFGESSSGVNFISQNHNCETSTETETFRFFCDMLIESKLQISQSFLSSV